MKLTGYFIKDVRQYGEMSEIIGELKSSNNIEELEKIKKEQEEYLIELVKRYQ
jgi:hypothetical protein